VQVGTFSIAAYDVAAGTCGVAISTAMPAIGALSVFAHAEAGAIATQAMINPLLGIDGLELLKGQSAEATLRMVLDTDPDVDARQVAIVDRHGGTAAHTGSMTHPWSGHLTGPGYVVCGNILVGSTVISGMAERFEACDTAPLHERLVNALAAGQQAGGDRRGKQSAALLVHDGRPYPFLDLRVDEHPEPVVELQRVHAVAQRELIPFVEALPTRSNPAGGFHSLPWGGDT
jgi:uncharacterized Ntn-hydrolase superfamily protein